MEKLTVPGKDSNTEDTISILENDYYWLRTNETFILIKTTTINSPKEINYIECNLNFSENKIKIIENEEALRKLPFENKTKLLPFNMSHLDINAEDLALIPNNNYAAILNNLKFRFLKGNSFIKAGKITIGVNLTANSFDNYEDFSQKNFIFDFEEKTNFSFIINGAPHSGKSTLNKNLILNIFKNNLQKNSYLTSSSEKTEFNQGNNLTNKNSLNENFNFSLFFLTEKINLYLEFLNFFGNCIENNVRFDASRYMRLTKFYFSFEKNEKIRQKKFISKIKFKHYLLEKNRILDQDAFNFHIFHCVVTGISAIFTNEDYKKRLINFFPDYTKYLIETFENYKNFILRLSLILEEIYSSDFLTVFYEEKFFCFLKIFSEISFHKKLLIKVCNIVLIILGLRDFQYETDLDGNALIKETDDFIIILNLLGHETDEEKKSFTKNLISREMAGPSGEVFTIKFKIEEANRTKENLIKYFYESLFDYINKLSNLMINNELEKVNNNFKVSKDTDDDNDKSKTDKKINKFPEENYFVQLIECFGFENSPFAENNSLENLLINYANDKINNLFFDQLIKNEISLYENEGLSNIDLKKAFSDKLNPAKAENNIQNKNANNIPMQRRSTISSNRKTVTSKAANNIEEFDVNKTIATCENESKGLFKLLDEVSFLISNNKGLITAFIDKIRNNWADNVLLTTNTFSLEHYGCIVEYGATDFIYKNVENLSNELKFTVKGIFKNLFSLTIKNFKFQKEKTLNYFMKKFNLENIEDLTSSLPGGKTAQNSGRLSVTRRLSRNILKSKSNSEKFLRNFQKLLNKIKITNLKIVKLVNTSLPFIESEEFVNCEDFINSKDSLGKLLEYYFLPLAKNVFENFEKNQFENFLLKIYSSGNDIINANAKSEGKKICKISEFISALNFSELENLIMKYEFKFNDAYVIKQIYSSGILESILLAKSGFFIRCDYKYLAEKLFVFHNFHDEEKTNEISEENGLGRKINIPEDWKPDEKFIKKISYLTKIDENDFIFGKSLLFVSNKALIKNPNLITCSEFPKLIITSLFKNIIKKVKNLKIVEKSFRFILHKRKIIKINKCIDNADIKLKERSFFNRFINRINFLNFSANKIRRNFLKYKDIKEKVIKLQRQVKVFFDKVKEFNKRKTIRKLANFSDKKTKENLKNSLKIINTIGEIKNIKGNFINKKIKSYLRNKTFKKNSNNLLNITDKIFNKKLKEKGLFFILKFFFDIKNLIKIQNLTKRKKSRKIFVELKSIKIKEIKEKSANLTFEILAKLKNKNNSNILNELKEFSNKKNLSTLLIQKNFRKFQQIKKIKKHLKENKFINSLCDTIDKMKFNFKDFSLKKLKEKNEEIKKAEINSSIKLQNLFRNKKANLKKNILQEEKNKEILLNKFSNFSKKIQNFESLSKKNTKIFFVENLREIRKEKILEENKNNSAVLLQKLIRQKNSNKKKEILKKEKIDKEKNCEKMFNLINKKFEISKKNNFLVKFNSHNNEIKLRNLNAIKLQSLIRRKFANKKFNILKENKKIEIELMTKKITEANEKVLKLSDNFLKKDFFNKFNISVEFKNKQNKSAILIQNKIRKIFANNLLNKLKTEKEIKNNKIKTFFGNLDKKFNKNLQENHKEFISYTNNLITHKNSQALKIQLLLQRKKSINLHSNLKEEKRIKEEIKKNNFTKGLKIFDKIFKEKIRNDYSINLLKNFKEKNQKIKNSQDFITLINKTNSKIQKNLLKFSLQKIQFFSLIKNFHKLNSIKKIQKNFLNFSQDKKIRQKDEKEKLTLLNTKNIYNLLNEKFNKFNKNTKIKFLENFKEKNSNIKKIILLQKNIRKKISCVKLNYLKLKKQEFEIKVEFFTIAIQSVLDKNEKISLKKTFEEIQNYSKKIKNVKKIQNYFRNFLQIKSKKNQIKKNLQLENKIEKVFCLFKIRQKEIFMENLIAKNKFIKFVCAIQKAFRSFGAKKILKEKKEEKLLEEKNIFEEKINKFVKKTENIFEGRKILIKKQSLINHLLEENQKFNKGLLTLREKISANKIKNFLKKILGNKKEKEKKSENLKKLILTSYNINFKERKLLKIYFSAYRKNVEILRIVEYFISKIMKIHVYYKYLKKKSWKNLLDNYYFKKTSKNILKKTFFKKYAKICREKIKKDVINSFAEFAKIDNSLKTSKDCKVETTQDTFSVIFSKINIMDDYMPDDLNKKPRLSAMPLKGNKLNKKVEFLEEDSHKDQDNNKGRTTIAQNPRNANVKNLNKIPSNSGYNSQTQNRNEIKSNSTNKSKSKPKTNLNPDLNKNYNTNKTNLNKSEKKKTSKSPIIPKAKTPNKKEKGISNSSLPKIKEKNQSINKLESITQNSKEEINLNLSGNNNTNSNDEIKLDLNFTNKSKVNKSSNINSTRKSITNYKQENNKNIKNYLNSDKKIQNELDSITSELNDLLNDADHTLNFSGKNLQNNIKNVSLNTSNEKGLDYWRINQNINRSRLKKIENPLELGYKGNIEKEFVINEKNEILKEEISSEFKTVDMDVLDKIQFKRDCLSNFPKTKK